MSQLLSAPLQIGDFVSDCSLPDGSRLFELRGRPIILAFAPEAWNPAHTYQSELFAQLLRDFNEGATFIEACTDDWHNFDTASDLASQFGVAGKRALFLVDEHGILRWKIEVEPNEVISLGEVIAALEQLKAKPQNAGGISRRAFLSATLAAAAVLSLPLLEAKADPQLPKPEVAREQNAPPAPYDSSGTIPVTLRVNGKARKLQLEPRVALLDALREYLHLTGTKKGCDHGQCGACTVHIDGERQLSCLTLAVMSQGKNITTIEGLASGDNLHPVQSAFIKHDAFQCGYCTPGQIMSATALIKEGHAHTDAEIRESMSGNLCRCAAYPNIIAAIKEAQGEVRSA
ncbi:putative xanthine dehydrogenase YagT iron-sulfur-binding subunit [Abditibacteriota bacterium]|nr:putative xanthine dehydrogenase YagT iron-sulfur-binding subunit [Abditibacteriota bacterium]